MCLNNTKPHGSVSLDLCTSTNHILRHRQFNRLICDMPHPLNDPCILLPACISERVKSVRPQKGSAGRQSTRGNLSWWSPATTVPAPAPARKTWQTLRTKTRPGTLTLQQVDRCPVVLSVLMNNWRWILNYHLLHSYICFPPPPPSPLLPPPLSHPSIHLSCLSITASHGSWSVRKFLAVFSPGSGLQIKDDFLRSTTLKPGLKTRWR